MNNIPNTKEPQQKRTYNLDDLAEMFTMSRSWIEQHNKRLTREHNFPASFARGRWLAVLVDEWFNTANFDNLAQTTRIPRKTTSIDWNNRAKKIIKGDK